MRNRKIRRILPFAAVALALAVTGAAVASGTVDPHPPITNWLEDPVTPIAEDVRQNFFYSSALILPFFFGPIIALLYAMHRFSAKRNPVAAKWSENVPLEVAWTVLPALVLVAFAIPTYPIIHAMENPPKSDVQLMVYGHQYFWQYDYPQYDVTVVDDGTGNSPLVVPVNKVVTMAGQATQVNHAWWVPAFAVKYDVIPGRINTGWFKATREGFYKGQCAELCGSGHAQMWIHVKVVSNDEFEKFILSKNPNAKFQRRAAEMTDAATTEGNALAAATKE